MTNVIISGPFGRMGQALCRLASENPALTLSGGLVSLTPSESQKPQPTSELRVYTRLSDIPPDSSPFVLIDFTEAGATISRLEEAGAINMPVRHRHHGFLAGALQISWGFLD